jgi:hypothetical protein
MWMRSRLAIVAKGKRLFVLAVCLVVGACHSQPTSSTPALVFSKVPQSDPEAQNRNATVEGRATGFRPGQRIVLYIKSNGRWGLQRPSGQPFAKIANNGRWTGSTGLGTEYAALLVDPDYSPPELTETLPMVGSGVAAVTVAKGIGPEPELPSRKKLSFSGYEWITSSGPIFRAGSRNFFDPANVWTDKDGALHLRISGSPGKWAAAEARLTSSLGYGTYRFRVRETSHLEPSAVLTMVSWDGVGTEQNRRELDVEISRWGYHDNDNAHFVVQPYYIPSNIVRFRVPGGVLTHSFRWEPGQATFSTIAVSANSTSGRVVNQHIFTSGIPTPGAESVRISLYVFLRGEIPLEHENEVVIDKFEYLP